jgi:NitT/TauT family transport system substrate-binding protein
MKATFPEMDASLVEQQFLTIVPLIDNPISKSEGFGAFQKQRVFKTWEWTAKAQNMPINSFDPEKAVNRSFIPK